MVTNVLIGWLDFKNWEPPSENKDEEEFLPQAPCCENIVHHSIDIKALNCKLHRIALFATGKINVVSYRSLRRIY
jgi:hypothetical protein